MPLRAYALQPSTVSRVYLKILRYDADNFEGILYSPHLGQGARFKDLVDMVDTMDLLFDSLAFPVAAAHYRSFLAPIVVSPKTARTKTVAPRNFHGSKDIFIDPQDNEAFEIHVQQRQNATWQGIISCKGFAETHFYSTLECIKYLAKTLDSEQNTADQAI